MWEAGIDSLVSVEDLSFCVELGLANAGTRVGRPGDGGIRIPLTITAVQVYL